MIQRYIKQFTKKINIIQNGYKPCGRKPCQCLIYLDLNTKEDKKTYLECYETWLNWKYK